MSDVAYPGEIPASAPAVAPQAGVAARIRLAALWLTRGRAAATAALVGMLVYVGSLWNGFAYDDAAIIPGDPRVTHFRILDIFRLPYWHDAADLAIYRPFTTLSFAVDWFVSHGYAWYFHAINIVEHGAVTALACLLLAELFAPAAALAGALVFAVHPVHVEAVANVVGRAEIVSGIFYLGALLLWVRGGSRPTPARVAAIAVMYAFALLHKESSATLPAALVLLDAAVGRWSFHWQHLREYARRVLPLLAVLALVLAGFIALRLRVLGRMSPDVLDPIFDMPMSRGARTLTALQAWPIYLRLLFFPLQLLPDYGPRILMPAFRWNALAVSGLAILLAVLGAGVAALVRGRRRTALALLWFPLTVLPVSNLLFQIGIIVAERTLYLPLLAVCVAVAAGLEWATRAPARIRRGAVAGVLGIVALLSLRTTTRVPAWETTDRLFLKLNADAPESFRGWWHLARIARRDSAQAGLEMSRYHRAMALWPYRRALVDEAAGEAARLKRWADARTTAAWALGRWPNDLAAQRVAALSALALGDSATARAATRAGLALSATDTTLVRLGRELRVGPAPSEAPR